MTKTRILSLIAMLALASPAVANTVKIHDGPGTTGGGEFGVEVVTGSLNLGAYSASTLGTFGSAVTFASFCVETNEYITFDSVTYGYTLALAATGGGSGGGPVDLLSRGSSWLYSQFAQGILAGYDYGSGRVASANALQQALWFLEDETGGVHNSFVNSALAAFGFANDAAGIAALKSWSATSLFGVSVLHLETAGGGAAQDLLYYGGETTTTSSVPDGGVTMSLLGMALAGMGLVARRRK